MPYNAKQGIEWKDHDDSDNHDDSAKHDSSDDCREMSSLLVSIDTQY